MSGKKIGEIEMSALGTCATNVARVDKLQSEALVETYLEDEKYKYTTTFICRISSNFYEHCVCFF